MSALASSRPVVVMERFQISLYVVALAIGAVVGLLSPRSAPAFEHAINPVLIVLL